MKGIIISFILAAIAAGLSAVSGKAVQQEQDLKEDVAVIDSIIVGDRASVNYYVTLTVDGVATRAKSVTYTHGTDTLHVGDTVRVQYYVNKAGNVRVMLIHDDLVSSAEAAKSSPNFFRYAAVILCAVGVLQIIKLFV